MPPRMKHQILPARRLHVLRCKLASRESIPGGACADSSANMGTCRGINSSAAGGGGTGTVVTVMDVGSVSP